MYKMKWSCPTCGPNIVKEPWIATVLKFFYTHSTYWQENKRQEEKETQNLHFRTNSAARFRFFLLLNQSRAKTHEMLIHGTLCIHQIGSYLREMTNQQDLRVPRSLPWESFQAVVEGREPRESLAEPWDWDHAPESSGKKRHPEVTGQSNNEEKAEEREVRRPAEVLLLEDEYWSVHTGTMLTPRQRRPCMDLR